MTRGKPVRSSTYATRLLVVPRSMPMMRDNLVSLPQRLTEVIDDGAQIRSRGQRLLERHQDRSPLPRIGRSIPRGGQGAGQASFLVAVAAEEPLALRDEPHARVV